MEDDDVALRDLGPIYGIDILRAEVWMAVGICILGGLVEKRAVRFAHPPDGRSRESIFLRFCESSQRARKVSEPPDALVAGNGYQTIAGRVLRAFGTADEAPQGRA